jgi:hypothetical protein
MNRVLVPAKVWFKNEGPGWYAVDVTRQPIAVDPGYETREIRGVTEIISDGCETCWEDDTAFFNVLLPPPDVFPVFCVCFWFVVGKPADDPAST